MGIVGSIIVYLLIWWTVLFTVLPMRTKSQLESGDVVPGTERGAPVNPELWFKIKRTSWIALILWVVVFAVVSSGVFSYER